VRGREERWRIIPSSSSSSSSSSLLGFLLFLPGEFIGRRRPSASAPGGDNYTTGHRRRGRGEATTRFGLTRRRMRLLRLLLIYQPTLTIARGRGSGKGGGGSLANTDAIAERGSRGGSEGIAKVREKPFPPFSPLEPHCRGVNVSDF
jgi:hypothetical protein